MTPSRITWLIRKFFTGRVDGPEKWSSHSCKATTLSWASKHGLEEEHRMTLGYHGNTLDRCSQIYGRDPMSFPTGQLSRIMEAMRRGMFRPDAPHHLRFNGKAWPSKTEMSTLDKAHGPLEAKRNLVIPEPKFLVEEDSEGEEDDSPEEKIEVDD